MVRTKADAALRVAAGGKAPKKSTNHSHSSPSSPTENFGKDNFPVNRYFPRETPAWQKKITSFFERNVHLEEPKEIPKITEDLNENNNIRLKRNSSVLNESNEMDEKEIVLSTKRFKKNDLTEEHLGADNHSMEMDE